MATIKMTYGEFQRAYPDSGDRILSIWKQAHDLTASQQTVAERNKTFHSFFKDMETAVSLYRHPPLFQPSQPKLQVERARTRYGFECLVMGVGSVVNQDQGLSRMYCTEYLEDVSSTFASIFHVLTIVLICSSSTTDSTSQIMP